MGNIVARAAQTIGDKPVNGPAATGFPVRSVAETALTDSAQKK